MNDTADPAVPEGLLRIGLADLQALAQGLAPPGYQGRVAEGALLPAFVARRALHLQQLPGAGALAGAVYWITDNGLIVGSCGFKDAAEDGWVEIGYGVAPACQRQGLGTRGVGALCRIAFANPGIDFVRACIEPDNVASAALARKLGFVAGPAVIEEDGTCVQVWTLARQAAAWHGAAATAATASADNRQ